MDMTAECARCDAVLDERTDVAVKERRPCPICGSTSRRFSGKVEVRLELRPTVTTSTTTHMWLWWAKIAIDQERIALHARDRAVELTSSHGDLGPQLEAETFASMIAVASACHSLDALYGRIKRELGETSEEDTAADSASCSPRRGRRRSIILETVKRAAHVTGPAGRGEWASELKWLFGLRDSALHYEESTTPTVTHPTGVGTSAENVHYRAEHATRAVNLAIAVLETCLRQPREPLKAWAMPYAPHALETLYERRR